MLNPPAVYYPEYSPTTHTMSFSAPSSGIPALRSVPALMGIVNVTPDSFADGGRYLDPERAIAHGMTLMEEGADILDVGGESARPGADPVDPVEEIARIRPVIEGLHASGSPPISVDTRHASVAEAALKAGATMINDISALRHDPAMVHLVQQAGCRVVLMHMRGDPRTMQNGPHYDDVRREVMEFFLERVEWCARHGITDLVLDPGIGFGKRVEDNVALLSHLEEMRSLGFPLLVGASNKSVLGAITGLAVDARLAPTIAAHLYAALQGVEIVRVHDVAAHRAAFRIWSALDAAGGESYAV